MKLVSHQFFSQDRQILIYTVCKYILDTSERLWSDTNNRYCEYLDKKNYADLGTNITKPLEYWYNMGIRKK